VTGTVIFIHFTGFFLNRPDLPSKYSISGLPTVAVT
jgi:hypothetical protein